MGHACTRDALPKRSKDMDDGEWFTRVDELVKEQGLQIHSGAFMKTILIIAFTMIGLLVVCCLGLIVNRRSV